MGGGQRARATLILPAHLDNVTEADGECGVELRDALGHLRRHLLNLNALLSSRVSVYEGTGVMSKWDGAVYARAGTHQSGSSAARHCRREASTWTCMVGRD